VDTVLLESDEIVWSVERLPAVLLFDPVEIYGSLLDELVGEPAPPVHLDDNVLALSRLP
jgi:hypothetical protein